MPVRAAAFTAAFVCVSTSAIAKDIERVGSTSLCGDAYLRALLGDRAPEKIGALSWQSRDALSRASDAEKALPQIWDDPELLLASGLGHIVFGPGEGSAAGKFLSKGTSRIIWGEDFEIVKTNFKNLGENLNERARTREIIRDLDDRLTRLKRPAQKPKILYLTSSGMSAGNGTFINTVIQAAGGENILIKKDKDGNILPGAKWPKPDPETLLALTPDLIVTSYFEQSYPSINEQPIRNPALAEYIASHDRLEIPGSLWPCAGPDLIIAAEMLNAKIMARP